MTHITPETELLFPLTIRLIEGGGAPPFSTMARIARCEPEGIGIEFVGLSPRKGEELHDFMLQLWRYHRLHQARKVTRPVSAKVSRSKPSFPFRPVLHALGAGAILGIGLWAFKTVRTDSSERVYQMRVAMPDNPIIISNDGVNAIQFRTNEIKALVFVKDGQPLLRLTDGRVTFVTPDILRQIPGLAGHVVRLSAADQKPPSQ